MDAIGDTAFWSTGAEVIAGLVVAVVFADVATTEPPRAQVRWFGAVRIAAFVAIAGGLGASLGALADESLRRVWAAAVVFVSVATLGGLIGIRLVRLQDQSRQRARLRDHEQDAP